MFHHFRITEIQLVSGKYSLEFPPLTQIGFHLILLNKSIVYPAYIFHRDSEK